MENYFSAEKFKKPPLRPEIISLSTNYDAWCKSRILWRANQYKFSTLMGCFYFDEAPRYQKYFMECQALQGDPVLMIWADELNWMALSTRELAVISAGVAVQISLDEINHIVRIFGNDNIPILKDEVDTLLIGPMHIKVTIAPGPPLFAIASILKMFPLVGPTDEI